MLPRSVFQSAALTVVVAGVVCGMSACGRASEPPPEPPAGSYEPATFQLNRAGESAMTIQGARVSADFFSSLWARPALGRIFREEDFRPGAPAVAILGHQTWQTQVFEGQAEIIGQSVDIDGRQTIIVGVFPLGFEIPSGARIWLPRQGGG